MALLKKAPKERETDENSAGLGYLVLIVFAGILLALVFLQDDGKNAASQSSHSPAPYRQSAERLGGNPPSHSEPRAVEAESIKAAPPAELIAREKMQALENATPSLEPEKQCFWLNKQATPPRWLAVTGVHGVALGKQSCYELDSCDGGLGKSRGDCYKWAASAGAVRDPW